MSPRHVVVTGAACGIGLAVAAFVTGAVLSVDGGASAGTAELPVHYARTTALQSAG